MVDGVIRRVTMRFDKSVGFNGWNCGIWDREGKGRGERWDG